MHYRFSHQDDHSQPSRSKVVCFGDSLLRNLEENILDLNPIYNINVNVYPGARISTLKDKLKLECQTIEWETSFVVLHVGTNNLEKGFWELDGQKFVRLFQTAKEVFRSAKFIFSLILPRWDQQDLYESSLYYNHKLRILASQLDCLIFDCCDDFSKSDDIFAPDGLHLAYFGKRIFAERLHSFLCNVIQPKKHVAARVPRELKILYQKH